MAQRSPRVRRSSEPVPTARSFMFFETLDDALAAFLVICGCRRLGFSVDGDPAHAFDDEAIKLFALVRSYQLGSGDEVSASEHSRVARHLRALRRDESMRRARVREGDALDHQRKERTNEFGIQE